MNICIFGDSITWGAHDYEKGGWVERLKTYYMENGDDIDIYNLGISGDNTNNLLDRFEAEARTREADLIILAIGINDSLYIQTKDHYSVDLDKFESNLSKLVKIAQTITDHIIFVGLSMVDESKTKPRPHGFPERYYDNESIKRYDEVIRKLCEENGLDYIDMRNVIGIDDLRDGLHPDAKGHEKIFNIILQESNKYINKIKNHNN